MRLSDLRITTKLIGAFATVLTIATVQSLFTMYELKIVQGKSTEIVDNWLPSVKLTSRINTATSDLRIAQLQHVLADNTAAMDVYEKELAVLDSTIDSNRSAYVKLISSADEQRLYETFSSEWQRYLDRWPQALKLSRELTTAQAQALLNGETRKAFDAASLALTQLIALNEAGASQASQQGAALYARACSLSWLDWCS